jgi:ATP-dependent protease ClpP protease subunit
MDDASPRPDAPSELAQPRLRLHGAVGDDMLAAFLDGLSAAEAESGPLVLELTTTGGDADVGRRIAVDLRLFRQRTRRRTLFLGKAVVYSAGVTVMSAFPRHDRWLAQGAALLIHCRKLTRQVSFDGPLRSERPKAEALLREIDFGLRLEAEDFERLIEGSRVGLAELLERAEAGWCLDAAEALDLGLIGGIV